MGFPPLVHHWLKLALAAILDPTRPHPSPVYYNVAGHVTQLYKLSAQGYMFLFKPDLCIQVTGVQCSHSNMEHLIREQNLQDYINSTTYMSQG